MARVLKPDGLVVIVESIQKGDQPSWDGLLDLFPHYFHEPYYAEYANGSLGGVVRSGGIEARRQRTRLPVEGDGVHEVASPTGSIGNPSRKGLATFRMSTTLADRSRSTKSPEHSRETRFADG